jgi:hypothetical protein
MGKHSKGYVDHTFEQETARWWFNTGSLHTGFTNADDPAQRKQWYDGVRRDNGQPMLRHQDNAPDRLYDRVFSLHWSVTALYKHLPKAEREVFQECMKEADQEGLRFLSKRIALGAGAGGKILTEGELITLSALHERNRKDECNPHIHGLIQRAGRTTDGNNKTLAIRNAQVLYREGRTADLLSQAKLALLLQERLGIDAKFENDKCVIHGVTREMALKTATRRQDALDWCKANGIDNPTPGQVTTGIYATRPAKADFDQAAAHPRWKAEAERDTPGFHHAAKMKSGQKPSEWLRRFLQENFVEPGKVVMASVKAAYRRPAKQEIVVEDVDRFLEALAKRPRIDCHRSALKAVRGGTFSSVREALMAAEIAYKAKRRPTLELDKGTIVTIKQGVQLTDEQKARLQAAAKVRGLALGGHEQKRENEQDLGYQRRSL